MGCELLSAGLQRQCFFSNVPHLPSLERPVDAHSPRDVDCLASCASVLAVRMLSGVSGPHILYILYMVLSSKGTAEGTGQNILLRDKGVSVQPRWRTTLKAQMHKPSPISHHGEVINYQLTAPPSLVHSILCRQCPLSNYFCGSSQFIIFSAQKQARGVFLIPTQERS